MSRRANWIVVAAGVGVVVALGGCGRGGDGGAPASSVATTAPRGSISLEIPLAPPPALDVALALPPELEGVTVETVPPATSTTSTVAPSSTPVPVTSPSTTVPPPPACTLKATVANQSLGFRKDSHEISAAGEALLVDFVTGVLDANPELRPDRIDIAGHASADGGTLHNQRLSERRAAAVEEVVSAIPGLGGVEVFAAGYGETLPIADNDTYDGRRANRRVEILIHFPGCSDGVGD